MFSIKRELENYVKKDYFNIFEEKIEKIIEQKFQNISKPAPKMGELPNMDRMVEMIQKKLDLKANQKDLTDLKSAIENRFLKIASSLQITKNKTENLISKTDSFAENLDIVNSKLSVPSSEPTFLSTQLSTLKTQFESLKSTFDQNRAEVHLQLHSLKSASPLPPLVASSPNPPAPAPIDPSVLSKISSLTNSLTTHIAQTSEELTSLRSKFL